MFVAAAGAALRPLARADAKARSVFESASAAIVGAAGTGGCEFVAGTSAASAATALLRSLRRHAVASSWGRCQWKGEPCAPPAEAQQSV
eukprot:5795518-Pleurochrysis_carterae.AAC.1